MARDQTRPRKTLRIIAWVVLGYFWAVQVLLGPFEQTRNTWIISLSAAVFGLLVALWVRDLWLGVLAVAAPLAEYVLLFATGVATVILQWLQAGVNLVAAQIGGEMVFPDPLSFSIPF